MSLSNCSVQVRHTLREAATRETPSRNYSSQRDAIASFPENIKGCLKNNFSVRRYIINVRQYIVNARQYIINARRYIANVKRYIINVVNYILGVAIAIKNRNCNKAIANDILAMAVVVTEAHSKCWLRLRIY
ncbi:hypothetical protein I8748_00850 [Nostoc sp. CENA67]|uniref:Uncharacterized protein n=1 Tax=Amazonocrinis nigriterrae CENA67 TaxID=2794033 RepID=A0A8J7HNP3_9NOST|nr:hypothetical protein [Amazonocrinis nigriterrae]MBH8560763.1 hypothetical protein [Amazonocrinis nigriterrae CENA67]